MESVEVVREWVDAHVFLSDDEGFLAGHMQRLLNELERYRAKEAQENRDIAARFEALEQRVAGLEARPIPRSLRVRDEDIERVVMMNTPIGGLLNRPQG